MFPFFVYFRCFLLQFVLGFEFIRKFQISSGSFESGLLSGISMEVWFWVVVPLFLGPNLLAAFSYAIDYQHARMTLTLMSVSNARNDYLKCMFDQLCYLLVILTQLTTQFYSCLNFLNDQPLVFRARMPNFSFLLYVMIDLCHC